ncbi:MAG: SUMF1/EgtB/PvdO family nonheme iron enzyme [Bacteroidales bacterium]|nr:SUMF1/EgtB/PvdO family nonheme iron enzyme [Bacteroidales bacterium]
MKSIVICTLAFSLTLVAGCNGKKASDVVDGVVSVPGTVEIKGVPLEMQTLDATVFAMGTLEDGRLITGSQEAHEVLLGGYAISKAPVSQELWEAVMKNNPSSTVNKALPVDMVDYQSAQSFVKKISKATGLEFAIPTEAQWENAFRAGIIIRKDGSVREWTSDIWSDEPVGEITVDPAGAAKGDRRVVRTWKEREPVLQFTKAGGLTFRLAVRTGVKCSPEIMAAFIDQKPERENVCANETIEVGGCKIEMVGVEGGTYLMGGTVEQEKYASEDENPVHEVTVKGFEIGKTEVTAGLWQAVMGSLPLGNSEADRPVVNVSWYTAQEFILKLNQLTGRKFRLPTEEEWEFAARGGTKTSSCRYSGSNHIEEVAVYAQGGAAKPMPVGKMKPNELGIYDMSGNAWEWCQDYYHKYGEEPQKSEWHMMRGGAAPSKWEACRVSNRQKVPASNMKGSFGFRLAL